mgnify:CR=1 FL=1
MDRLAPEHVKHLLVLGGLPAHLDNDGQPCGMATQRLELKIPLVHFGHIFFDCYLNQKLLDYSNIFQILVEYSRKILYRFALFNLRQVYHDLFYAQMYREVYFLLQDLLRTFSDMLDWRVAVDVERGQFGHDETLPILRRYALI